MSGTILIVEDDEDMVEIVRLTLKSLGFAMHHVSSGQEALEYMLNEPPNLVLVDLRLPAPSIKGWELIKLIKDDERLTHIPTIAVTASGGESIMWAMKAGCDSYLEKPFAVGQLRRMVARFLGAAS